MIPTMADLDPHLRDHVYTELGQVEAVVTQLRNTVRYRDDAVVTEIFERAVAASSKLGDILIGLTAQLQQ